jgi:DNA modification methylase
MWQRYASPIWVTRHGEDEEGFAICTGSPVPGDDTTVDPSDTLQHKSAREAADEKHIAPLQKEVIRRGVKLWSNPGDTVFTPFAGIGSELVVSLEMGRRAVGSELKRSYFEQAARNCAAVVETPKQVSLFDALGGAA